MSSPAPLLIEVGNTTIKVCEVMESGDMELRRFTDLQMACTAARGREQIVVDPAGVWSGGEGVRRLEQAEFIPFIGDSYDAPLELGLDRILHLLGMEGDGVAISCGTAITVDAVAGGRPSFGAILPGLTTASHALHTRIPALPEVIPASPVSLPARTPVQSVANGIILGTALAVAGLVGAMADLLFPHPSRYRLVLTGGDADVLARTIPASILPAHTVDSLLLFRGMAVHAGLP